MTNTTMLPGGRDPAEILASVQNGIYAVNFGGLQVDITSGKFVFRCTEAYRLKNGKVGAPHKGAMLIGNGPDALTRVNMIGNDLALDTGIATCGTNGQGARQQLANSYRPGSFPAYGYATRLDRGRVRLYDGWLPYLNVPGFKSAMTMYAFGLSYVARRPANQRRLSEQIA